MAFSFSNWFKKPADAPTPEQPAAPSAPVPAPISAPTPTPVHQTRPLAKTATPNSVRPVNLREGARPAFPGASGPPTPSPVSLKTATPAPAAGASARGTISFPGLTTPQPVAPAAPARASVVTADDPAPPPPPDTIVTLSLGDFFDRIPVSLLKSGAAVDRSRPVSFAAADLYSDLSRGRASIPASAIQTACPDLFSRPVDDTEDVEVALPLSKLVEQLGAALQTRSDQVAEEDVAEIETPFLQVALEDSVRLPKPPAGTTPATAHPAAVPAGPVARRPLSAVVLPASVPTNDDGAESGNTATVRALAPRPVQITPIRPPAGEPPAPNQNPLHAPTAHSVAPINSGSKRPPSTVRASVAGGKIRLSGPAISSRSIAPAAANSTPTPLAPTAPPAIIKPISTLPLPPSAAASAPASKKTARIQLPSISLRQGAPTSPGAPTAPPPPMRPSAGGRPGSPGRPAPFAEPLLSFRAAPGESSAMTPPPAMPAPSASWPQPTTGAPRSPLPSLPAFPSPPPPAAFPVAEPVAPAPVFGLDGPTIALGLAAILRAQPAGMFLDDLDHNAAADRVGDEARVLLPLAFITSQLGQGRVAVPRAMFIGAMPEAHRALLPAEGEPTEVLIPLQEVFQSLPTEALSRREDQVIEEVGPEIPTPFSMKAQEDAERLRVANVPAEPTPEAPEITVAEMPTPVATEEPEALVIADPTQEMPAPVAAVEPEVAEVAPTFAPEAEVPPFVAETEANAEEPAEPTKEEPVAEAIAPEVAEETPTPVEANEPVAEPVTEAPALTLAELPPAEEALETAPVLPALPPMARIIPPMMEAPAREITPPVAGTNGHRHPAPAFVAPPMPSVPTTSPEEVQEALRAIFMVEDDLDAKKIVRLTSALPGLKACAIMFSDGLKLAGDLEGINSGEGFCAMAPAFYQRVRAFSQELHLGETQCVTVGTERALLSFFMRGDICLSVQHAGNRPFLPGVREKLLAATDELARMYAPQTAAGH